MSSRYGDNPGGRVVPLKVAKQLLAQRDELVAEVQRLRRTNDRLKAEARTAKDESESLAERVQAAEDEAKTLRERLANTTESAPKRPESDNAASEETLSLLHRRIEQLTGDLERIRRRTSKNVDQARREERVRLLSGLGDVFDSVERALDMEELQQPWRQGLEGIRHQLLAYLKGEGASIVGEVGESLDPHIHQAIATVDSADFESGQITHVDRVGIVLDDEHRTVVRPAQVIVAE